MSMKIEALVAIISAVTGVAGALIASIQAIRTSKLKSRSRRKAGTSQVASEYCPGDYEGSERTSAESV